MSKESSQKWLERNRPPRVQISYEVETNGASVVAELPLVVGVLADLSGMYDEASRATVGERRFIEIDRDNFDGVLNQIGPRLDIAGLGLNLGQNDPVLSGSIVFKSIDDFDPDNLVASVSGLKELFEARNQLRDLMAKLDGNAKLEASLQALFPNGAGAALTADQKTKLAELVKESTPPALAAPAPADKPAVDPNAPAANGAAVTPAVAVKPDEPAHDPALPPLPDPKPEQGGTPS